MGSRKRRRQWLVLFGSDLLRGRDERRRARSDLRRGIEPQQRYATGRYWTD